MQQIVSPHNPRFKSVLRLKTSRGRSAQQQIIIFGLRETRVAAACNIPFTELFVTPGLNDSATLGEIEQIAKRSSARLIGLPAELYQKLSYGDREDEVVAVADRPSTSLGDVPVPSRGLHVILESIEKPGNIGAVARTADAAGASSIILANPVSDLFHPNAIRSSMGGVFSLPAALADTDQVVQWLTENDIKTYTTRVDAPIRYDLASFADSAALVFGSEAQGLSAIWTGRKIESIRLPMLGRSDSLNVSTTAAIVLYEAMRQRGFEP